MPGSEMWQLFCLMLLLHQGMACDRSLGPSGTVNCIVIPRYNYQYQWATCLTDAYIQQKSSHKHQCIDRTATYCWYQCMLEVHDKNSGPVSKDCSCSPITTVSPPVSPTTSLPPECYSPSGDSCDWYRNCLERKYPCEATSNAYAIAYAEKFCRLYGDRKTWFTEKGQKWVDGVRKCLQVSLVPLLRPWSKPTCQEIREKAFASHTPCYLNPDKNVPSVCDLDCVEYFKIFFVIKGSFAEFDTAYESMKGMWNIGKECGPLSVLRKCLSERTEIIKFTKILIQKFVQRKRRSSDPLPEADARSRFAYRLGSAIANSMAWNKEGMDWLAYSGNVSSNSSSFDIFIVLVDKKGLGIINDTKIPVNLNKTVQSLASAIKHGRLPLQVDGFNVWLKSMASCANKSCEHTQTLAVSDKPPTWHTTAPNGFTTAMNPDEPTNSTKVLTSAVNSDKPPNWHSNACALKVLGLTVLSFMLVSK